MKNIRVILCGCGGVGKEFLQLLADRGEELAENYGLRLQLAAAVDLHGGALAEAGDCLPVAKLIDFIRQGNEVQDFPTYGEAGLNGVEVIGKLGGDALVEATPTNLIDGGCGKDHIVAAIENNMEVISANKGPFVLYFRELFDKAKAMGCGLHISAATAAALPTLDIGLTSLAGTRVSSAEGILNGTTNYILSEMRDNNTGYDEALKAAQQLGIAETDPSYDVEGKDTANKIVLIANRIFNRSFTLSDISVRGITEVSPTEISEATKSNKVIKLIGSAIIDNGEITLTVEPKAIGLNHPLAQVNGSEKAITYTTDTMGAITVMGGKSSPVGAAAALLKDLLNAYKVV
ncbi:MAG: homoserine dehydrogenase [Desulforhopalus sp.]